jgi:hypothetical protein
MIRISPTLGADLAPTADGMELRFSSGETVPMRKKVAGRSTP